MLKVLNKKNLSILCLYILPIILFLVFLYVYFFDLNYYKFSKKFCGFASIILLSFILFVKPISKIFSSKIFFKISSFRKELGILMFYFFLVHMIGTMLHKNLFSSKFLENFKITLPFFWGVLSGVIIIILGLTSNNFSVKKLNSFVKMGWKKLQYLVYFSYAFALIHIFLINKKIFYLVLFFVFLILKILEFSKVKIDLKRFLNKK